MPENSVRETAQIIPFPTRNRGSKSSLRDVTRQSADRLPVAVCDFGSAWYHDVAIQDEARKHSPR